MKISSIIRFILVCNFFIVSILHSQNLSNLTPIAYYPLAGTANDTTLKQGPMFLINTPFQKGGIYCNGNYLGNDPDSCEARTPEIEEISLASFGVSLKFLVEDIDKRRPIIVCGNSYRWLTLFVDLDTTVGFALGGYFSTSANSGVKFSLGVWHEIAATYKSAEGMARLYLDGTAVDSGTVSLDHHNDKNLGITHGGLGLAFKGYLKDLKIYTKMLSALEQDSLALVALYHSTNGPQWIHDAGWLSGPLPTWYGITIAGNRVQEIRLSNNNLAGFLPPELGALSELRNLELDSNKVYQAIPSELGKLSKLRNLILNHNQLTGSIPPGIGTLKSLAQINLQLNQLSGSIPSQLGDLADLYYLNLSRNQLSGSIPPELGSLSWLHLLYLYDNQLTGTIPAQLGELLNLNYFSLNDNQLSGPIPSSLGNLKQLESLQIANNHLIGAVPKELVQLTRLTGVSLAHNQLSGSIPHEFIGLANLRWMDIQSNQFVDLPDVSSLANLVDLHIENNQFSFEDIEPNIAIARIYYSPQDSVGVKHDTTVYQSQRLTLIMNVGGKANRYQWYKNDVAIHGADSSLFVIPSITFNDSGIYTCKITNTIATALILHARPIKVSVTSITGMAELNHPLPNKFALTQNYPNPFNSASAIRINLPQPAEVLLTIYDLRGHVVCNLVQDSRSAGFHQILWDGRNDLGQLVASGLYIYRAEIKSKAGDRTTFQEARKMMLIK